MVTKKNKKIKDINYYLGLPWTFTIEQDKDEFGNKIYVIRVNEIPEAATDASCLEDAIALIEEALALAIEIRLDLGEKIPEPVGKEYKGSIAYRTTPRRHYIIAREAQKRGQSLSKFIDTLVDSVTEALRKN